MIKYIIIFVTFMVALSTTAQENKHKFGEASLEEVSMKAYPKDSSADAVVLFDYGESYFKYTNNNIFIVLKQHTKVKILKKSALDRASSSVLLYKVGNNEERIFDIKGFTYNLIDGKVVKDKLSKDMIFKEKSSDNYTNHKFTLPNVKEGSVIEYSYEIETPMTLSHNPKMWIFQRDIPVLWSEYRIEIPNIFYYTMLMSGYLPLAVNEKKPLNIRFAGADMPSMSYRFVVENGAAFRDEPYITTTLDYVSKIDFELASIDWTGVLTKNFSLDYASMNKTLLVDYNLEEQLRKTNFLKNIAKEIKAKNADTLSQWRAAKNYVFSNIKWDGKSSIYSTGLKKVFDKKEGDAGDINLLLTALLREMGYDANPLILSTRSNGYINETYALLKKFNYLLAYMNYYGKDIFLDATDEFADVGIVPTRCLNKKGWLVHPTEARFVSLIPKEQDREYKKAEFVLNEEGELSGKLSFSYAGYGAIRAKSDLKETGQEKYLEEVKKDNPSWSISKVQYSNTEPNNKAMEATFELNINEHVTKAGNLLYLKPILSDDYSENPFKASERSFPVDFGCSLDETYMANFEIPEGYKVIEAPKSASITLPSDGGRFSYMVRADGRKINVVSKIQLKKSIYYADEYLFLKEFFDKIIEKHQEQIVIRKEN